MSLERQTRVIANDSDAQSICVATAGTNQIGKEGDILRAVLWHSILLGAVVGLLTMGQAYLYPLTLMVPK